MTIDISSLGLSELTDLIQAAEVRKKLLARRRPIAIVRRELEVAAAKLGYSIDALFGTSAPATPKPRSRSKRKLAKVAVKYRDPDNRRNIWTGRGSQPRWLREKVRRGMSPADFLIDGIAKPTANTKSIGKRTVFKQS